MNANPADMNAADIARAVSSGALSARSAVDACLARIAERNPLLNAFTAITAERARATADKRDAARAKGAAPGALEGVPFAVKNLFDVAGLPTVAGSRINRTHPPAKADATLVQRLEAQGAILVGALNMGEYAYDFTGENVHDGPSRNPHDPDHMSGGSSGGSGGAVASGMVPLALGSDTNGSIRVPSSFCGLFGLKPTYGRLSRARTFPFVASFDHLGPFARSVEDLALSYDAMQGADAYDPSLADKPVTPAAGIIKQSLHGLRIARLGGYFARGADPAAFAAVDTISKALGVLHEVEFPGADRARASAYLITMAEGGALHLDRLRNQAHDFDPDTRDRLSAGAMLPAAWIVQAQKFRRWYYEAAMRVFDDYDVLIAPAAACRAPRIGQKTMVLDGQEMLVRPNIGLFTQPISFIGLPVVAAPVWTKGERLPMAVQIIAPPWREDLCLRVAYALQDSGAAHAPIAAFA